MMWLVATTTSAALLYGLWCFGLDVYEWYAQRKARRYLQSPGMQSVHANIHSQFDAREWAVYFELHWKAYPKIPSDVETMTTWFANAIMAGYDHWPRRRKAALERLQLALKPVDCRHDYSGGGTCLICQYNPEARVRAAELIVRYDLS